MAATMLPVRRMLNKKKVDPETVADVCLVLEGTYPYVGGGVSTWVHDLIRFQPDVSFHLVCLTPHLSDQAPVYDVPKNVIGATRVAMRQMPLGRKRLSRNSDFFRQLEPLLIDLQFDANIAAYHRVLDLFAAHRRELGEAILIRSREAWTMI